MYSNFNRNCTKIMCIECCEYLKTYLKNITEILVYRKDLVQCFSTILYIRPNKIYFIFL